MLPYLLLILEKNKHISKNIDKIINEIFNVILKYYLLISEWCIRNIKINGNN